VITHGFISGLRPLVYLLHAKVKFLNMYRLTWKTKTGVHRSKHFTTLRKMNQYVKRECAGFSDLVHYSIYNGRHYEPFALIGNSVYSLSRLRSILAALELEQRWNAV